MSALRLARGYTGRHQQRVHVAVVAAGELDDLALVHI